MASELEHLQVRHEGKRYTVLLLASMGVDAQRAYKVFTDYPRLTEINDAVVKADPIEGAPEGAQRLHTQVRVCIIGICRTFDQVQDMVKEPPEALTADVIPELSNLKYGKASWRIWDQENGRAKLRFEATVEPDFWVPPLIGPWLIKRKLEQEAVDTANGIERLALAL